MTSQRCLGLLFGCHDPIPNCRGVNVLGSRAERVQIRARFLGRTSATTWTHLAPTWIVPVTPLFCKLFSHLLRVTFPSLGRSTPSRSNQYCTGVLASFLSANSVPRHKRGRCFVDKVDPAVVQLRTILPERLRVAKASSPFSPSAFVQRARRCNP